MGFQIPSSHFLKSKFLSLVVRWSLTLESEECGDSVLRL
jgi:hypothetical protein